MTHEEILKASTPRPWDYEQNMRGDGTPIPNSYTIFGNDTEHDDVFNEVADIYGKRNAALIVRAVNAHEKLVEALAYAIDRLDFSRSTWTGGSMAGEITDILIEARAALALARGE